VAAGGAHLGEGELEGLSHAKLKVFRGRLRALLDAGGIVAPADRV
jgi:hypothetical protein